MNYITKIWAKSYLKQSPIFKSPFFQSPNNEYLICINPRLFTAYCIKMLKQKHYSNQKVNQLIRKYYGEQKNYWLDYVKQILQIQVVSITLQTNDEQLHINAIKFRNLMIKLYHKNILWQQFSEFRQLYYNLASSFITQFDNYLIDHSFHHVHQIAVFSQIGNQQSLETIDSQSISFLQNQIKKNIITDVFSYLIISMRIKQKLDKKSQLYSLFQLYLQKDNFKILMMENQKHKRILMKQSIGYIIWLLHLNQLGHLVQKNVKQNYLYNQYLSNSIKLIGDLLLIFQFSQKQTIGQIILLNQIIIQIQDLQKQKKLFVENKKNLQMEMQLRKLRDTITNKLTRLETVIQNNWIQELNNCQIDFRSSLSIKVIKKMIDTIYQNQYFPIVTSEQTAIQLIKLARKINYYDISSKISMKFRKNIKFTDSCNSLLCCLQKIYNKQPITHISIDIHSIYQLKRIKELIAKMNFLQINYLKNFPTKQQTIIKKLQIQLKKNVKQLNDQKINNSLNQLFTKFRL